ncbi:MAG: PKD domain-containing protein [Bacteroidia bacterium]|nr:PKD domain-containing protein [Bacteroidia bacterium]
MRKFLLVIAIAAITNCNAQMVVDTFYFTGSQQIFVVPSDVDSLVVYIRGADGGSPSGGAEGGMGGLIYGTISVTPSETLSIYVGGTNGYNGGGTGGNCSENSAGNGGGASDIRRGGTGLNNRFIVAGGGGGGAKGTCCSSPIEGGDGGGITGYTCGCSGCGGGGTQLTGGSGGSGSYPGAVGNIGNGGNGGIYNCTSNYGFGGGGGGGYYGGGGGAGMSTGCGSNNSPAGGGGGSSLIPQGCITVTAVQSGNGLVILKYNSSSACKGTMTWGGTTVNATCFGCEDGNIDLSVTTTNQPITFQWNTSATSSNINNLFAGYYSCAITDSAGCSIFPYFTITQPQPSFPLYFQNVYGMGSDTGNSIIQTIDSGFVAAGSRSGKVYVQKIDKAGYIQWSHTYDDIVMNLCATSAAHSIKQTFDGGYIVTGFCSTDIFLLKINSNGVYEWGITSLVDNPENNSSDYASSVIQTSDSGYVIAGATKAMKCSGVQSCSSSSFAITKFNINGSINWYKLFHTGCYNCNSGMWPRSGSAKSIIQAPGGLVAAGWMDIENRQVALLKIDNNGNVIGSQTYGGSGSMDEEGNSVVQTTDGGFLIAGYTKSFGAGNSDFYLIKTAASGNVQWSKTYGGTDADVAYSVKQTPDGGYIVLGETKNFGSGWGNADIYLLKTDASGNLEWAKVYGGYENEQAREIQVCTDGGYIIAGTTNSYGSGTSDIYLLRTDINGNLPGCEPTDVTALTQIANAATVTYIPTLTEQSYTGENDIFLTHSYANTPWVSPSISTAMSSTGESACQSSDGAASVNASDGTAPYAYYWSNGANTYQVTNLTSQIYSVTVTDSKGCANKDSVTVFGFTPPSVSVATIAESACLAADGIAALTVTGGNPPYSFAWSNLTGFENLSGLTAGAYFVTVTDSVNCTVKDTAVIAGFTPPIITLTGVNPSGCGASNGAVILSISGGQSPFIYQWNTGSSTQNLTNKPAGVYAVSVTDNNGCLVTGNVQLTDPSSLAINVSYTDVTVCGGNDGTASVTATGGNTPYTYQWSNLTGFGNLSGLSAGNYAVTVTDNSGCTRVGYAVITTPQSLVLTVTTTAANCDSANGSASITASGGTNPYSYLWSNGANLTGFGNLSGLSAGIYVVTVTDSIGCSGSTAVPVSNSSGLTVVPSVNNTSCYGNSNGSISLSVSGGNAPYSYQWSNGSSSNAAANLQAGPYEVTVTDADTCMVALSIYVGQPQPIIANVSVNNATCGSADGIASVSPSGGNSPYSYFWSNGASTSVVAGLAAGIYAVSVVDSLGCGAAASAVIGENGSPNITLNAIAQNSCGSGGGSIDIAVTGGIPPYTYQWSNGAVTQDISNLYAGTYAVTVTGSNGCKALATYTITGQQPQQQPVCLVTTDANSCNNIVVWERVQLSGISHYNIYRETTQSGVYQLAATIPFSQLSQFTDINSNAQLHSWRYKMSAVDTCGNESMESPPHQTIHLTANLGVGNTVNLIWNHYDGFLYDTYYIWRYKASTGWLVIDSISSNLNSYTDTIPGIGTVKYFIEAPSPEVCTASAKAQNHNGSRSNVKLKNLAGTNLIAIISTTDDGGACDGTANAMPIGGQAPYTYQWSSPGNQNYETVTELCEGDYSVTVTDVSGDFTVQTFSINVCPKPEADFAVSQTSGNAPLHVDFFDISANMPDSVYWTFYGATPISSTLPEPANIVYNSIGTFTVKLVASNTCGSDVEIKSGYITVTSSGGSPLNTYLWSDSSATTAATAVNLCADIYSVTVMDAAGDSYIATVQIPFVNTCLAPIADFAASQTNGTAPMTVDFIDLSDNAPASYQWTFYGAVPQTDTIANPVSITYNTPGTYSVKLLASNSCGSDVEIKSGYITVTSSGGSPLSVVITAVAADSGNCEGIASVAASGGTSPYTYLWSDSLSTSTATAVNLCAGIYSVTVTDADGNSYIAMVQIQLVNICLAPITDFAASQTNGTAPMTVDFIDLSNNSPTSYQWTFYGANPQTDTVANPVSITYNTPGTYSVKLLTSNSYGSDVEIKSGYITVTSSGGSPLTAIATVAAADSGNCEGIASITASGGTPPYAYLWSDSAATTTATAVNLCDGIYSVTVTDADGNNYIGTAPMTVDFIDLSGNAPDSYQWTFYGGAPQTDTVANPVSITYNTPGTYSVKLLTSNSCGSDVEIKSGYITVTSAGGSPLTAVATVATADSGNCEGIAAVTASGGTPPYTYLWSDSVATAIATAINLCADIYNVTVTDADGNSYIAMVQIPFVNTCLAPIADFAASQTNGTAPMTVDFIDLSSNSPTSYQWTFYGGAPQTDTVANPVNIIYNTSGTYSVKLIASNSCESDVEIKNGYITVIQNIGIEEHQVLDLMIQIIPNPNSGNFILRITNNETGLTNFEVKILNVLGQEVWKVASNAHHQAINEIPVNIKPVTGIYNVLVITEKGVWNGKVVIQ